MLDIFGKYHINDKKLKAQYSFRVSPFKIEPQKWPTLSESAILTISGSRHLKWVEHCISYLRWSVGTTVDMDTVDMDMLERMLSICYLIKMKEKTWWSGGQ